MDSRFEWPTVSIYSSGHITTVNNFFANFVNNFVVHLADSLEAWFISRISYEIWLSSEQLML